MSDWAAKRFWTDVNVVPDEGGFAVQLDGRPVKTPAKAALVVPTHALGEAVAEEWRAIDEKIDPNVMPFTRSANAAIDKVRVQFDDVAGMLGAYGGSDLLCYRATHPDPLIDRQAQGWDPLLDWADKTFGARLHPTAGIMPVEQDAAALSALAAPLYDATPFELTALHDLIALSGSLVLGLAVAAGRVSTEDGWALSRIDEVWQAEQWGDDEEAMQAAFVKKNAFEHAHLFYKLSNDVASV